LVIGRGNGPIQSRTVVNCGSPAIIPWQGVRMTTDSMRRVTVSRIAAGRFRATNDRGASVEMGGAEDLSPVELLLAALGGCTALDVDALTSRRSEPDAFDVIVEATKVRDEAGNRLTDILERFRISFPDTAGGAQAREILPAVVAKSHDRLCTVGRTVQVGSPIATRIEPAER
jgi:uncharacterized OsmC-like protein